MLIGISGKLGSGKDTIGNMLKELNPKFELKSFAYKLKYITSILTGVRLEDCFTQEGKNIYMEEWGMTVGEFQQKMGTEGMRQGVHENGWIISLFADYEPTSQWIITDVRFENEALAIKNRGGILIRVNGDPAKIRKHSKRDLNHPSETGLDHYNNWNFIIENENKTLEDLKSEVNDVFSCLND